MTEPLPIEVSHVSSFVDIKNSAVHKLVENNSKFQHVSSEAKVATDIEHAMTLREAIRRYPKAIGWSILLSAAIAMEGYDSVLCSQFLAFPTFVERYGVLEDKGETYAISAAWQAGLGNGARVGEILGLLLNGLIAERFGFKKTMLGSLVLLCALIFIPFFAPNIATLEVGQILLGIPWVSFQWLSSKKYILTAKGCLSNFDHSICGGGLPSGFASIPHKLREPDVGGWSARSLWRPPRLS